MHPLTLHVFILRVHADYKEGPNCHLEYSLKEMQTNKAIVLAAVKVVVTDAP